MAAYLVNHTFSSSASAIEDQKQASMSRRRRQCQSSQHKQSSPTQKQPPHRGQASRVASQPLPNRHWPQVITTLGGREEIVHVAMPEEDKRDATLPRAT